MKAIILAGPPRAGKDVAGKLLAEHAAGGPWLLNQLQVELKERCHAAYRLYGENGRPLWWGYFEQQKEVPLACFEGRSPRQAYAAFMVNWVLPVCGEEALGRWALLRAAAFIKAVGKPVGGLIFPDTGRASDAAPIVKACKDLTYLKVQRDGCTFDGDPRVEYDLPGVRTAVVVNPGDTEAGLLSAIRQAAPHLFIEIATEMPA